MTIYSIGIDLGTSGCRGALLALSPQASTPNLVRQHAVALPASQGRFPARSQNPTDWWQAVSVILDELCPAVPTDADKLGITINGTSGSVIACQADGQPLGPALMYNDAQAQAEAKKIAAIAPRDSGAQGPSSGLAKISWLQQRYPHAAHFLHQADWIANRLSGDYGYSDENNALKSGYDIIQRAWPEWLNALALSENTLPNVLPPGSKMGKLAPEFQQRWGITADIIAGTTDSIAAFLATGANQIGDAVSALGSTLAVKLIVEQPIFAKEFGVYSHRLGDQWLVGGASNTGGAVLRHFFSDAQLHDFTTQLDFSHSTGLNYYPLLQAGERFPIADPQLAPQLQPRPEDDAHFFQGILESITRIEKQAYQRLHELGASYPKRLFSTGGGAKNRPWLDYRQTTLNVTNYQALSQEACFGSALLGLSALK